MPRNLQQGLKKELAVHSYAGSLTLHDTNEATPDLVDHSAVEIAIFPRFR